MQSQLLRDHPQPTGSTRGLRQLWSVQPALFVDNAKLLAHAFIASCVDCCNSILYQAAAVHLRPLQLVLNAAAHLVVKKRIRPVKSFLHDFRAERVVESDGWKLLVVLQLCLL